MVHCYDHVTFLLFGIYNTGLFFKVVSSGLSKNIHQWWMCSVQSLRHQVFLHQPHLLCRIFLTGLEHFLLSLVQQLSLMINKVTMLFEIVKYRQMHITSSDCIL